MESSTVNTNQINLSPIKLLLKQSISILTLLFLFYPYTTKAQENTIIPLPAKIIYHQGFFPIDSSLSSEMLLKQVKIKHINNTSAYGEEGYNLIVNTKGITISASTHKGIFYAQQTLLQLRTNKGLPFIEITDKPRFPYRGLLLDVSRHFYPIEELYKIVDAMAFYKLNNLQLHLTDAGGWRIQLDSYPLLTRYGAFRSEENWTHWWNENQRDYLPEGTPGAYGGYYTKKGIAGLIRYAQKRNVNIIPEIEFPGHSEEVFIAYPQLCCTGKPGTGGDFCVGNPEVYTFIDNVLNEIIQLFPSPYIHIGGDEAGKQTWKSCQQCQALMKANNMKSVDELQSYLIHHIDKFLQSKGRKMIGWDEIIQGGLSPNAIVMAWTGETPGFKSARDNHYTIMSPHKYCYFDQYQANPATQPFAIGGYIPLKKVYSYNPCPQDTLDAYHQHYILGIQGNTWTEYIPDTLHLEYMMFPRALAIAEVGWTLQENKDWQNFKKRANHHIEELHKKNINAFSLSNEIEIIPSVDTTQHRIFVKLDAEKYPGSIRYTTNGTIPTSKSTEYVNPISVKDSANIVAALFLNDSLRGLPSYSRIDYHKAINKKLTYYNRLYPGYMAGGMKALVDGYTGGFTYLDGKWQGYLDNLDCVIDMDTIAPINSVSSRWMQLTEPGVFQPEYVELLISDDGDHYVSCGKIPSTIPQTETSLKFQTYTFTGKWNARYIRLKAKRPKGFIFVDEIIVW